MSTAATLQFGAKRLQISTAALAVATAAAFTPVVAHAGPSLAPFAENVGSAASLVIDPVVVPSGNASASDVTDPCVTANFKLGCYAVQGAIAGTQSIVRGVVVFVGTTAYVLVAATGELLKAVGNILPGPVGDFFTNVGDGVSAFANNIAESLHVGPYQTSE